MKLEPLKTDPINGVTGVLKEIQCHLGTGWHWFPAVVYGDWAIRREGRHYLVVHVPTGLTPENIAEPQDIARSLMEVMLKAPRFRTVKARKALAECSKLYYDWRDNR